VVRLDTVFEPLPRSIDPNDPVLAALEICFA